MSNSAVTDMLHRLFSWRNLSIALLALLLVMIALPIFNLILLSLKSESGHFSLASFIQLLNESEYIEAIINSIILATIVTTLATLLGVVIAYITATHHFPLKSLLAYLPISIIVIPEIISAQSWLMVFGNNGVLTHFLQGLGLEVPSFYGWFGMIYVMTLTYYVHIYMATLSALKSFDRQLLEAAYSLGESPFFARLKIMIPLIGPAVISGALVVFTLVIGNFAIAMTLGQSIPLLSIVTYKTFLSEVGANPSMQSALATVSIVLLVCVLLVQRWVVGRSRYEMAQGRPIQAKPCRNLKDLLSTLPVFIMMLLSLLPFAVLIIGAFTRSSGPVMHWGEWTLKHFDRVFTFGMDNITNTAVFASAATLAGVIIGTLIAYLTIKKRSRFSPAIDFIAMLPLAVSGTVLGIALAQASNIYLQALSASPLILILAYIVRRLPFSVRNASTNLYSFDNSVEEASISLGASPLRTFIRITIPMMSAGIISAAVLMWALTVAELNSSIVVYSPGLETLPIQIFRLIDSDIMSTASAYGVVMISMILLPIIIASKVFKLKLSN